VWVAQFSFLFFFPSFFSPASKDVFVILFLSRFVACSLFFVLNCCLIRSETCKGFAHHRERTIFDCRCSFDCCWCVCAGHKRSVFGRSVKPRADCHWCCCLWWYHFFRIIHWMHGILQGVSLSAQFLLISFDSVYCGRNFYFCLRVRAPRHCGGLSHCTDVEQSARSYSGENIYIFPPLFFFFYFLIFFWKEQIEADLQCCGWTGPTFGQGGPCGSNPPAYKIGCEDVLKNYIHSSFFILAMVSIGVGKKHFSLSLFGIKSKLSFKSLCPALWSRCFLHSCCFNWNCSQRARQRKVVE
jgi:hypothetical protein